jgi:hypothetical protein
MQKLTKPAGMGATIWLSGIDLALGNPVPVVKATEGPRMSIDPVIPDGEAQPYAANRTSNVPNLNVLRMICSPNGVEVRQARFKVGLD